MVTSRNNKYSHYNYHILPKSKCKKYMFAATCGVLFFMGRSMNISYLFLINFSTGANIDRSVYFRDHFFNHDNNKQTAALGNSELSREQRNSPDRDDNNTSIDGRWRPNTVTYGLLHMQKTGGTTINGELAMHYERVCGNKGYSHDYYSSNKKIRSKKENLNRKNGTKRMLYLANDARQNSHVFQSVHAHGHFVPFFIEEIGLHDCDFVANEIGAPFWAYHFGNWYRPLELHIPCRDPIDHLMSMCAFRRLKFRCNVSNVELQNQVDGCIHTFLKRFSMDMALSPNFTMKCFSSPSKIDSYIEYMGERLQKKRIQGEYFDVTSNKFTRHKETECIWEKANEGVRKRVEEMIFYHISGKYFKYCKDCIGSENDLLR
mmetsp:Transcript_23048/g.46025  ORF Transcript_23048/g.46025 Transcript_23048/m.46025 type:complete len:375 (-) Transcript_23048:133-1257(-)